MSRNGHVDSADSAAAVIDTGSPAETNRLLRVRRLDQLLAEATEGIAWIWEGYLARGALTVLGVREKAGNSTLVWALISAMSQGRDFLGRATTPTPMVVLTEEPTAAIAEKVERFGIPGDASVYVVSREGSRRAQWEALLAEALAACRAYSAGLLIIDTLAFFANLPAEAENDSGAMTAVLRPLVEACSGGLAVLALHHANKAHGELRGSTAIGAAADIIMTLTREPEAPVRRRLETMGRFAGCPAEPVLIELDGDRYTALGTPREVSTEERERQVLGALPTPAEGPGLTQREVAEATGIAVQRVAEALTSLRVRGQVTRTGQGTRGAPYRYHRAAPDGGGGDRSGDSVA